MRAPDFSRQGFRIRGGMSDDLWASSLLIGNEHVGRTLSLKAPAWANTSSTRVQ